jgi:hypothetical protein
MLTLSEIALAAEMCAFQLAKPCVCRWSKVDRMLMSEVARTGGSVAGNIGVSPFVGSTRFTCRNST